MNLTVLQVDYFDFIYVCLQDIVAPLIESETQVLVGEGACDSINQKLHIEMVKALPLNFLLQLQ